MSQVREVKRVVFSFGRMNPPTLGHKLMIEEGMAIAEKMNCEYLLFPSRTEDKPNTKPEKSRNPLAFTTKLAILRRVFPRVNIIDDPKVKSPQQVTEWLAERGYTDVTFVVGSDRVEEFENRWLIYTPKFFYQAQVWGVGNRDDEATNVNGTSGTKARLAALNGNLDDFQQATLWSCAITGDLFTAVREGMGLESGKRRDGVESAV